MVVDNCTCICWRSEANEKGCYITSKMPNTCISVNRAKSRECLHSSCFTQEFFKEREAWNFLQLLSITTHKTGGVQSILGLLAGPDTCLLTYRTRALLGTYHL